MTVNPPILNTDEDFLVYAADWQRFIGAAARMGWQMSGSCPASEFEFKFKDGIGDLFVSLTHGKQNIIYTPCEDFFKRFLAASSIAKRLNLRLKIDRIRLFQAVLYGNADPENVIPLEPLFIEDFDPIAMGI